MSVLPQYVQDIAQAAWTSEIISNYQAHQEEEARLEAERSAKAQAAAETAAQQGA